MTNGQPHPDDLLSALHDGELSVAEREAAERLLEASADARSELEDYRALKELLLTLPAEPAPEGFRTAVMRRIERESLLVEPSRAATAPRRSFRRRLFLVVGSLGAAVALLFAFVPSGGKPNAPVGGVQLAQRSDVAFDGDDKAIREPGEPAVAMRELGEREAGEGLAIRDGSAASLDMLATNRGAAFAGSAAKPPDGFSVGDVYSYLEQTEDGEIVVVQATVVDVHRALEEMQVLLARNSIQTMPVSTTDENGTRAESAAAATNEQDLALYVESDPVQMNAALTELREQSNLFLRFDYAGVLDPVAAPVKQDVAASSEASDRNNLLSGGLGGAASPSPANAPQLEDALGRDQNPGEKKVGGLVRPQARAMVPSERFSRSGAAPVEATRETLPKLTSAEPRSLGSGVEREMLLKEKAGAANEAPQLDVANGYQAVLNVPRDELKKQLDGPQAPAQAGRRPSESAKSQTYFYAEDGQLRRSVGRAKTVDEAKDASANAIAIPQGQRRYRLLVVLEPQTAGAKAMKADAASPQAAPVEAPVPNRKKG
jgi:hypothetical protein